MRWIVGVYVVVFFLFESEFIAILVLVLNLLFVRVVDLEELSSMRIACHVMSSVRDKKFGGLDLHGGGLLRRLGCWMLQ